MKKKLELLTTGFVTVVSLIALICATFSWFTVNKQADSSGTALVSDDDISVDYTIYKCDNETHVVSTKDSSGNKLVLSNLELNKYDAVFTEKNAYSPIIVIFTLSGSNLKSSGHIGMSVARNTNAVDGYEVSGSSTTALAAVTSNVCSFGAGLNLTLDTTDDETIYNSAVTEFQDGDTDGEIKTFVTIVSEGNYTKVEKLYFDADYTSSDFDNGVLKVSFYISYNDTLAAAYVDGRDESLQDIVSDGLNVPITNDLTSIKINH